MDSGARAALALYDAHRYHDAYLAIRSRFEARPALDALSLEELVHGARLALRMGGGKLSQAMLRAASAREPDAPLVRLYARDRVTGSVLEALEDLARRPELGSGDDGLECIWHASAAFHWASVRDFDRARSALARAEALGREPHWTLTATSYVSMREDRWADALTFAERAQAARPNHPATIRILADALSRLERDGEAWALLSSPQTTEQCFESTMLAAWHAGRIGEREGPTPALLERYAALVAQLPRLTPLATRRERAGYAAVGIDLAELRGDRAALLSAARAAGSSYARRMAQSIEANPEGRRRVLPHRAVHQHHDTCLPASFATVMSSFGVDIDHEALSRELTYAGTAAWRLGAWCGEREILLRGFVVNAQSAGALIASEIPFILVLQGYGAAHAVAVIGLDEAMGVLLLHDPSAGRLCHLPLVTLSRFEAPHGPLGLVALPAERASELDALPLADVAECALELDHDAAHYSGGPAERAAVLARAEGSRHPKLRLLGAMEALERGQASAALEQLRELLRLSPHVPALQQQFLAAAERLESVPLLRAALESIVEGGALPGTGEEARWLRPPPSYRVRLADVLSLSRQTRGRAERLLRSAIADDPGLASGYHVLADLWHRDGELPRAELCYRLASTLAPSDEHYARAYADALHARGAEAEAEAWLRARVAQLGDRLHGGQAHVGLVDALLDWGRPEAAAAQIEAALAARPDDPSMCAALIPVLASIGELERVKALLPLVEAKGTPSQLAATLTVMADFTGDRAATLAAARRWAEAEPTNLGARRVLLRATGEAQGRGAALALARSWVAERPGHEGFELMLLDELAAMHAEAERTELLERRVARNPEDGWAWRELALSLMDRRAPGRLERALAECERTAPELPATLGILGQHALREDDRARAIELFSRAIERDPDYGFAYTALLEAIAGAPPEERARALELIDRGMARASGRLELAGSLSERIAQAFGLEVALAALARWRAARGETPQLVDAEVDLRLGFGGGQSDATWAVERLKPLVARYPRDAALRSSLAWAYRILGDHEREIAELERVLACAPLHSGARSALATTLIRLGRVDEAIALFRDALRIDPLSTVVRSSYARALWGVGRHEEAIAVVREGAEASPGEMPLWSHLVELVRSSESPKAALGIATDVARRFPDSAEAALLSAREHARSGERVETERAYRRVLALDAGRVEAVDELASLLSVHGDHDAALAVLDQHPATGDARVALDGRRAWILRRRGERPEARAKLLGLIREHPDYRWGWATLLEWIDEDKAIADARALPELGPSLAGDLELVTARLDAREAAGEPVDAAWEALCRDHVHVSGVTLGRVDRLLAANRLDEAEKLLEAHAAVAPSSRRLPLRRMRVALARSRYAEVDADLERIWAASVTDAEISDDAFVAWARLEELGRQRDAALALVRVIERDGAVHTGLIERACEALEQDPGSLERLLTALERQRPPDTVGVLAALDRLTARGPRDRLDAWIGAHRAEIAESPLAWWFVGLTYLRRGDDARAVEHLQAWRSVAGAPLAAVRDLCAALHRLNRHAEVGAHAREALERLSMSSASAAVASLLFSGRLLSNQDVELLADYDRHGALLGLDPELSAQGPPLDAITQLIASTTREADARAKAAFPVEAEDWLRSEWQRRWDRTDFRRGLAQRLAGLGLLILAPVAVATGGDLGLALGVALAVAGVLVTRKA